MVTEKDAQDYIRHVIWNEPHLLPDGVHLLSEASLNTLERAHIRDQILEARHIKRGS